MNIQRNIFGGLTVYCFTDKISHASLTSDQCKSTKRVLIAQTCLDTAPEPLYRCAVVGRNHRVISCCVCRRELSYSR